MSPPLSHITVHCLRVISAAFGEDIPWELGHIAQKRASQLRHTLCLFLPESLFQALGALVLMHKHIPEYKTVTPRSSLTSRGAGK